MARLEVDLRPTPVGEASLALVALTGESGTQMGLLPDIRKDKERRLLTIEGERQAGTNGGSVLHGIGPITPWHAAAAVLRLVPAVLAADLVVGACQRLGEPPEVEAALVLDAGHPQPPLP